MWRTLLRSFRSLGQHPVDAALVVITIGLGIGVNTGIFSVADATLLRPLPGRDPNRLAVLWTEDRRTGRTKGSFSEPEVLDLEEVRSLDQIAAIAAGKANLTGENEPEQLAVVFASPNLLDLLGISPVRGRGFLPGEGAPGYDHRLLVSYALWQRRLGGDPLAVGRDLRLDGEPYQVVGILPESFELPFGRLDAVVPMRIDPANLQGRGAHYLQAMARLAPGSTLKSANTELAELARRLQGEYPLNYPVRGAWTVHAVSLRDEAVGDIKSALLALSGAGFLVLLITCSNVTNLLLARNWSRREEFQIKGALGITSRLLGGEILSESCALALVGGGLGIALGHVALWSFLPFVPAVAVGPVEPRFDAISGAFSLLLAFSVGLVSAAIPALAVLSRFRGGRRSTSASLRGRGLLVSMEVALALIVAIGAAWCFETLVRLGRTPLGFEPEGAMSASISVPVPKYETDREASDFVERVVARSSAISGVEAVGAVSDLPFSGGDYSGDFTVEGREEASRSGGLEASRRAVAGDYFRAIGIPRVAGRGFEAADRFDSPGVVIVDDLLAKQLWSDREALGKRLKLGRPDSTSSWLTVVGVVRHVRHDSPQEESRPQMYFPLSQFPRRELFLVVRSGTSNAADLARSARRAIQEVDPDQPVADVRSMVSRVRDSLARERFSALLVGCFAATALVLAAAGLFGVLASWIAEQRREIAIRAALGERRTSLAGRVFFRSAGFGALGGLLGLIGATAIAPSVEPMLGLTEAGRPVAYLAGLSIVAMIVLLSTYLAARRALAIEPATALQAF